jgi:glycosyltransferase involved in cell wall biosynthesis
MFGKEKQNNSAVIFLGTTTYDYPLNKTTEKKFELLSSSRDVFVIAFSNKKKFLNFKNNAQFNLLPRLPSRGLRFLLLSSIGTIIALRLLKKHQVRIIFAQDPYQGFVGALVKSIASFFGNKKIKLVIENHGDFENSIFIQKKVSDSRSSKKMFNWLAGFSLKRADALRGVSQATVDQLKKWNNNVPIVQFPAWTDMDVFSSVKQQDQLTNPTIIFAGALAPIKGVKYLIEAFNKIIEHHSQARLLLVGKEEDQQYVAGLKQQIRNYNLDNNVEFIGEVSQQQLADMFSQADIFVLPSLSEGLPRVIFEAMATGLPVVGTRVGGIPDLIDHQKTGLLVESQDADALSVSLLKLIQQPEEAKAMGERGREFAKTLFSADSYLSNYNNLCSLVEGDNGPDFIGLGGGYKRSKRNDY